MNIQSVQAFDAAVGQLGAIKGDITEEQQNELINLFSTQIWNSSDAEGTKVNLERQIQQLTALLDEIQGEIDALYEKQKSTNQEMVRLLDDINEESYQASLQMEKNAAKQQDLVKNATDEAYRMYMKGEITKEEVPLKIASLLSKGNPAGGAQLEACIANMEVAGYKIASLNDKITSILDSINEFTAKFKTTEASLGLMKTLLAKVPEHKERADIQGTIAKPIYTPIQEELGDKLIDAYTVENDGNWADGNEGTSLMKQALAGSTEVNPERKAQLDAMSDEDKAAAVKEADTSKYSALELLYLSGLDVYQAGKALETIFNGAGIGYNEENGAIRVPNGHDPTRSIYNELKNQYTVLWGGQIESASEKANGEAGGKDPFSFNIGNTTYTLAIDRDKDGQFDGQSEFVGAQGGWDEVLAADANKDGSLSVEEMYKAGFSLMENDQNFTGGGTYGWNDAGSLIDSIDLDSFKEIAKAKTKNLNGNTRAAEFTVNLKDQNDDGIGEQVVGKQTLITEEYSDIFYGHTVGEAFSFGLEEDEVKEALTAAAKPENYTEYEEKQNNELLANAKDAIEQNKADLRAQEDEVNAIDDEAASGKAKVNVKDNEVDNSENADDTNNTTAPENDNTALTDNEEDEYKEHEEV